MRRLFAYLLIIFAIAGLEFACTGLAQAQTVVNNQIAMSYNTMSVTQMTVANSAMRAGGNFSLSVQAVDGGGRGPPNFPNDVANLTITFYNYSNGVIGTATSNNTTVFNTWNTYTVNSTNCGGASCSQLAYLVVRFTGNDGGYWAGNVGTNFKDPKLTFTPTGQSTSTVNILYNPEFGVNGTYSGSSAPHGWSSSTGSWGGNTRPQLINNGGTLNAAGGGFSAGANSGNGQAGGYPQTVSQYPSYMTVGNNPGTMTYGTSAAISTQQQTRVDAFNNRNITNNTIYVDQVGDNNTLNISQSGRANELRGIGQQAAVIQGSGNNTTIRQGDLDTAGKNSIELRVVGDTNTLNLNQSRTTTGAAVNSSNNHYQRVDVAGYSNSVTTQQTNTGGVGGHYMETTITGNTNTVNATQTNNANKTLFTTVSGSNNTVNVTQKDGGQHYLESILTGSGNTITAVQEGATANRASITINNNGGPGAVDLIQSGGANYNITTTCVTAGGCGTVTVRQ